MIDTIDANTPTTPTPPAEISNLNSEIPTPPLGLVPFKLVKRAIYRDGYREVTRYGKPGAGNAFADYSVQLPGGTDDDISLENIHFQHDTIPNVGVQGATNECLLAMVIDRLRCFQSSPLACDENKDALMLCERALAVLEERTAKRKARGVEGTHTT